MRVLKHIPPRRGRSKKKAVEKLFLLAKACGSTEHNLRMNCIRGDWAPLMVRIMHSINFFNRLFVMRDLGKKFGVRIRG
jgi:hypothetical protein